MTTPRNDARIVIENIEKVEVAPDMRKPADAVDREAGEGDGAEGWFTSPKGLCLGIW